MKRKVIQIAESTQLVSLPRKWAKSLQIKKGDELDVEVKGNTLVISAPGMQKEEEAISLRFDSKETFLKRPLSTLYRMGYDEIRIKTEDPAVFPLILEQVIGLIGFEIVQQSPGLCIVKRVASGLDTEFDQILRRIFLVLVSMAKDAHELIVAGKTAGLKEIAMVEKTTNKLAFFSERILNKKPYKEHSKVNLTYTMIFLMEMLGDDLRDFCMAVAEAGNTSPKLSAIFAKTTSLIDEFHKLYYDFDFEYLLPFKKKQEEIETEATALLKNGKEGHAAHLILKMTDKLQHMTECLA